ncbi:hypothetical protein [Massilia sp. TS11]|uniref:hypothetical protein n=1 Tax=Massilia sp. TS11 TaxID=2908003 RepID=UPI001EDB86A3|nr:hypothetical protein [Massilia sp. TS11]MCG2585463.1 hypothetical protein [Massilia sp. TS11]
MSLPLQALITDSVQSVIRRTYPQRYSALCHAHAIVGANLISIVFNRVYRPVAGFAIIDCGGGQHIHLRDNQAFANEAGGAYHCWIESVDETVGEREVIDLTVRNNREYAEAQGVRWLREDPPTYLWGHWSQTVLACDAEHLPHRFPPGMTWLRETDAGWTFITRHLHENMNAYVSLTAAAIQALQARLPRGSQLLAPLIAPSSDSAPASAPVLVG